MKKLNKLHIKYFNNIELRIQNDPRLISNGGFNYVYELTDPTLNDFYEFHIDGKPLIQHFFGPKKMIGYLEQYNGLLGTRDKIYDELLVKSLLKTEISIPTIKAHYSDHNRIIKDEDVASLIYELGLKNPLIYGCKICDDRSCGGKNIGIKKTPDIYSWLAYNKKSQKYDKEIFNFDKSEYEEVFANYLSNWKKANARKVNHHQPGIGQSTFFR